MATYGKKLLDLNGNIILPKTRSSLVYMNDNSTVEDKISSILSGSTVVGKATYATSAGSAVDQTARNNASSALSKANAAMPKAGGTFTGGVYIGNDVEYGKTWAIRNCNPRTSAGAEVSGISNFFFYRK